MTLSGETLTNQQQPITGVKSRLPELILPPGLALINLCFLIKSRPSIL